MYMLKDLISLGAVILSGFLYYIFSSSKVKDAKDIAFTMKMVLLIMPFILAFVECDYITIGDGFVFGGRTSVMMLIMLEIIDAYIDKKK